MTKTKLFNLLTLVLTLGTYTYANSTNTKLDSLLAAAETNAPTLLANDCDAYFPLNKGVKFEHTNYTKKGKEDSKIEYEIIESKAIDNGILATFKMNSTDNKGKEEIDMTYEAKCQNSKYYINMENMFAQITSTYKEQGMEISFEDGFSVIPNNIAVGDKLEDAEMIINMSSSVIKMKMTLTVTDKEIIGKETITTPAGTYDCMILTQTTTVKLGKMMSVKTTSKHWIAKGVGSVKTENYDKNGKLEGYTLLTQFTK